MLKSILSNKLVSQKYIFPEYRFRPQADEKEVTSCTEIVVEDVPDLNQVKGLGSGEQKTPHKNQSVKKKVYFERSWEQKDGGDGKQTKPSAVGRKKKHVVKDIAAGDASCEISVNDTKSNSWDFLSTKWAARLQYLSELEQCSLKHIQAKAPADISVSFCDNQSHLNLGSGPDYSATFLGYTNTGVDVAVKKINVKRIGVLLDEAMWKLLASLNSPSLAKIYFITRDKTHFYIVKELCENSLAFQAKMRRYIPSDSRPPLDPNLCLKIANSLAILHSRGIAHQSLKPENIFLTASGDVKLADYHIHERCLAKKAQYSNGASSLSWLPSEILGHAPKLTMASDIASLGIIFHWIMTDGGHPFGDPGNALDACLRNIKSGRYNLKSLNDPFAHHLIQHMIYKEPEKRMTIGQVLDHPYFWMEDTKIRYIELLARAFCTLSDTNNSNNDENLCNDANLKHFLKTKERAIYKADSSIAALQDLPLDVHGCLEALFKLILNTMRDDDTTIAKKILKVYPALIIEVFSCFSVQDLEEIVKEAEKQLSLNVKFGRSNLQPCLSADSGICSPNAELTTDLEDQFDSYEFTSFLFDSSCRRKRDDSDCYASTDDGIDILSPTCGSLKDEALLSAPIDINYADCKGKLHVKQRTAWSPMENCSSVDTNFEFDVADYFDQSTSLTRSQLRPLISWTDMDELD